MKIPVLSSDKEICTQDPEIAQINKSPPPLSPIDTVPEEPTIGASMTSLHGSASGRGMRIQPASSGADRRQHRRHDLEPQGITVERVDANRKVREKLGE